MKVSRDNLYTGRLVMAKYGRCTGNSHTAPSPLADRGAWRILAQFLETEISYSEMEEKLSSYLGDRYSADDWKDAKATLFSGEDDLAACLRNLELLRKKYIPRRPRPVVSESFTF
jgi:hypothetical protein